MWGSRARWVIAATVLGVFGAGTAAPASGAAALQPVGNLSIESTIGVVTLSWTDPHNDDGDGFVVCSQRGTTPMFAPSAWCAENNIEQSTSHMAGFPPNETTTFSVWPRDASGNLGPAKWVTTLGSVTTMATVSSEQDATTGLRLAGTLIDSTSGNPLAGETIEIYLGHRHTTTQVSEWDLVTRLTSDQQGRFARTFPLRPGLSYQARFQGGGARMGNLSKLVPADGSSYIDLDPEYPGAARSRGRKVRLVASVPLVHRGDRVVFQRMGKGHWRNVAVRGAGTGRVAVRVKVTGRRAATFRAVLSSPGRGGQPSVPVNIRRR